MLSGQTLRIQYSSKERLPASAQSIGEHRRSHFDRRVPSRRVFTFSLPDGKMSRHPEVKWAERFDKVYLTILLADAKNVQINLDPDGVFTFSGMAGSDNIVYELKLELYDKVNVETSKLNTGVRSSFCVIEKAEKGWWKKLLRGEGKLPHYIKVDWDKWVDEDENDGPNDDGFGGMDFSKFGNMGAMDGDDDLDDSDDEEAEVAKNEDADEAGDPEKKDDAVSSSKNETVTAPST